MSPLAMVGKQTGEQSNGPRPGRGPGRAGRVSRLADFLLRDLAAGTALPVFACFLQSVLDDLSASPPRLVVIPAYSFAAGRAGRDSFVVRHGIPAVAYLSRAKVVFFVPVQPELITAICWTFAGRFVRGQPLRGRSGVDALSQVLGSVGVAVASNPPFVRLAPSDSAAVHCGGVVEDRKSVV